MEAITNTGTVLISGITLPQHAPPPPPPPVPEAHTAESWFPFSDRVEFDFAHLHFVRLQSSAAEIKLALDMWAAQTLETFEIEYQGPRPPTPPAWMTQKYTLLIRNIQTLFHHQMRMKDFDDTCFNKVPYRQFNKRGEQICSNIMSADWAWKQCDILAEDPTNHGAMFVPFVSGSNKTTASVATGHQEYHPIYASPCNVTNVTRRSHPFALCPIAFLAIPKSKYKPIYQKFVRQMYHGSLAAVFEPLHAAMTVPEVVMCPDGHYWRVIYGLGPYIADYPEQVYLAGIVSGWCPKCMNHPEDLDAMNVCPRTRTKTDFLITCFDPGIIWDEFGVRSDVVPFTSYFPRADIHELLTPYLLHQMIKGTFKDHLVEWVADYIHKMHPLTQALEILKDIDRQCRVNAAPPFPGLRRFPDGRDFAQWTGDDSKALMKVYLAAIVGYVPPDIIKAMSSFLDFCYIARRNSLSSSNLSEMDDLLTRFHHYRTSFINSGVREAISLPCQHGLTHYVPGIRLFGSPNGLCSSITESKHIKSKELHSEALTQMVTSITRSDKLVAMKRQLEKQGMTVGATFSYMSMIHAGQYPEAEERDEDRDEELHKHADLGPATGPATKSSVHLAVTPVDGYPPFLSELAVHIEQNSFPAAPRCYLWGHFQGDAEQPQDLDQCLTFSGKITVYHSAISRFYAPSDLCGVGGMHSECIRSHPHWRNSYPCWDTVFVVTNQTLYMCGLTIARVLLFFTFTLDAMSVLWSIGLNE
ncbi:hypothetical protein C8R41DRAFT_896411 [Lentinula lateritia]|uniref:Uncharacterized protein n=1 Tax=Lentinula lateritia TaxID=40482 RepID=A0ABQ8VB46_9AGAR|nr:hypothetical protein C8R41DRAFT_896411 [Lentinula lateritia]